MKSTLFAIFRPALLLAAGLCLLSCTKEVGEALLTGTDPVCFEVADGWSKPAAAVPQAAALGSDGRVRERPSGAIREEDAGAERPMFLETIVTDGIPGRPQAVCRSRTKRIFTTPSEFRHTPIRVTGTNNASRT